MISRRIMMFHALEQVIFLTTDCADCRYRDVKENTLLHGKTGLRSHFFQSHALRAT
jgi:hypothetical protein